MTAGRDTKTQRGFVNPSVVHGSTALYPTATDLRITKALQEALMVLESRNAPGVGIASRTWPRSPLLAVSNACSTLSGRREAADRLAPQVTVRLQATVQLQVTVRARRQNTDC